MGVFAEHQPRYASHDIPTFPVLVTAERKKPAAQRYDRIGIPGSAQLALKFPEVDALAFMAGKRTKITVLDIDSPDEDLLRDMMKRHGQTPIIVRSGSGNFHAWYRFNGEERKVRPDASIPVDLLGGGVVVAPPSKGARGAYEFIRGSLADLHKLRPAANIIDFPKPKLVPQTSQQTGLITEGRNKALFDHLMRMAHHCDDLEALLDVAFTFAGGFIDRTARHTFTDNEIRNTAKSAWDITARGDNRFGGPAHSILLNTARDQLHELGPDVFFLYSVLQKWAGDEQQFPIANGMADHMPGGKWARKRFAAARAALVGVGAVISTRPASSGKAALFKWGW
jgi:hypothetical protein